MKYPPFGKLLAERIQQGNLPSLVHVLTGPAAWDRARSPAVTEGNCMPLVWANENDDYRWPVAGCFVSIEWHSGMSWEQVALLASEIVAAGAVWALVWPSDRSLGMPVVVYPNGDTLELSLESLRIIKGEATCTPA